jgi:hypothetical protein
MFGWGVRLKLPLICYRGRILRLRAHNPLSFCKKMIFPYSIVWIFTCVLRCVQVFMYLLIKCNFSIHIRNKLNFAICGCGVMICNEKPMVLFEKTAMWLWSQRTLRVQGDAGHPGWQGGGQEKIIGKTEGWGGGEAQGVADKKIKLCNMHSVYYIRIGKKFFFASHWSTTLCYSQLLHIKVFWEKCSNFFCVWFFLLGGVGRDKSSAIWAASRSWHQNKSTGSFEHRQTARIEDFQHIHTHTHILSL